MSRYELEWLKPEVEQGPVFKIGRDVYERPIAGGRLIRLHAVESYPSHVAPTAIGAFRECAKAWGAPIVYIIDPNLLKAPAARFLFEWSRTTHAEGTVEQCFMKTSNILTKMMGKIVLRMFTDGSMPFETVSSESALETRLAQLDLTSPQDGFTMTEPSTALVHAGQHREGLLRNILSRAYRRAKRTLDR